MTPYLRIMECQRRDKAAGVKTVQEYFMEMGKWSQTFKNGWDFHSERQREKKYLAKLNKILNSMCVGTKPIFCSLINQFLVLYILLVFLKELLN